MIRRGRLGFARLAVMVVVAALFVVPSAALGQTTGGDQTLNQSQTGSGGGGGSVNQIQQGAQQNCTVGGSGRCNQSISQNAQINAGGGAAPARRVQFVRSVPLARTGFDAWILVVLGGASLAGGVALMTAQRRRSSSH